MAATMVNGRITRSQPAAGSSDNIGAEIVSAATHMVKNRPVLVSGWFIGLLVAALGTGFSVTETQLAEYQDAMHAASKTTDRDLVQAKTALREADQRYYNAKGWFWQCDANCQRLYTQQQLAAGRVAELEERRGNLIREARSTVGIWSTVGVSEVRESFWHAWEHGKETAKRWTMMDSLFMLITPGERERTLVHVIMQIMFQYLANLTVGLLSAMFFFLMSVVSLIRNYGEGFVSGVAFFGLVVCAVCATVGTYLTAIGGTMTIGAKYVIKKEAERLQSGQYRGRVGQRAHYD